MAESCPRCGVKLPAIRDAFCPECRADLSETPTTARSDSGLEPTHGVPMVGGAGLWQATEGRVLRHMKLSWYDDRGSIEDTPHGLLFRGHNGQIPLTRITAVHLVGPIIPWAAVASLAIGNLFVLVMAKAGLFDNFTLETPITYLLLVGIDLFALASWPMNWVKVDYIGENGQPDRAYYTTASTVERWMGGPKRLCALLRRQSGEAG